MTRQPAWTRVAATAMLLFAAALYLLHFFHLGADFPNHSPWMDWAKYTDEGWYGDAAIRYYLLGTWHLPGDFNPGAALPVWPLLEALVFRFTGVGIVAARALTVAVLGVICLCSYRLLCVPVGPGKFTAVPVRLFALAAVMLLCANPFVYAFSRMAILEPLLILWMLCALLVAVSLRGARTGWRRDVRLVALGVLLALMIGTKTTAIFLLPAVAVVLWSASGWRLRAVLRDTAVVGASVAVPAVLYLLALRRAGMLADVRYLFAANDYTGITAATFVPVVWQTLQSGSAIGPILYSAAGVTVLLLLFHRAAWRDSVFVSLVLWAAGYLAYIAYHANVQPRYYLVVAVPLLLLFVRGGEHLVAASPRALVALVPLAACMLVRDTHDTLRYVTQPEYTFQRAAQQLGRVVLSEPLHSHTVLSISGSTLSLMTGLPSICDDFGTMQLEDRIAAYKPGWFVTWNYVEDDKMQALSRWYRLTRTASIPAMDDPDRNLMIVYRLDALAGVAPKQHSRKRR